MSQLDNLPFGCDPVPFGILRGASIGKKGEFVFDEFCAQGVDVHFEVMDDGYLWVGITKGNERVHLDISSKGRISTRTRAD